MRNALKSAIKDLVYALDKYCDVFFNMPSGYVNALDESVADEDVFYFKDLLASFEQDRTRAYQLMMNGVYSKRKYLKEYEGFNDKEIDEMFAECDEENAVGRTKADCTGRNKDGAKNNHALILCFIYRRNG